MHAGISPPPFRTDSGIGVLGSWLRRSRSEGSGSEGVRSGGTPKMVISGCPYVRGKPTAPMLTTRARGGEQVNPSGGG